MPGRVTVPAGPRVCVTFLETSDRKGFAGICNDNTHSINPALPYIADYLVDVSKTLKNRRANITDLRALHDWQQSRVNQRTAVRYG
jgi:hypothetical protein